MVADEGSSFSDPQLETQALTSSSGTASRVRRKSSYRPRSSWISGPEAPTRRIEQSNGFGENGRNVLPSLLRHLAKTGVGIDIDLK